MLIVRGKHTRTWTVIGAALGTALGTALGNAPLGLAAGAGVGLAVALLAGQSRQARGLGVAMPCRAGDAVTFTPLLPIRARR